MRPPRSLASRTASAVLGCSLAGSLAMSAAGAAVASRGIASDSPAKILSLTLHATSAAKSFRVACHGNLAAIGLTESSSTSVGATYGAQSTTITEAGVSGTGRASTRLVGGVAYFKGNASFLQIELNVRNSKYANRWISVKPGQRDYGTVASGLWLRSALVQVSPVGKLSKSSVERYRGESAVMITGNSTSQQAPGAGKAHVYVSTSAPYRPLAVNYDTKLSPTAPFQGSCSFSHWRLQFSVVKPASSTPITKTNL
jgi:hypothetical protein